METLKHTPGPWHTSREMLFDVWAENPRPDAPRAIYKIVTQVRGPDEEVGEANARLIAAAPELLGALRDLVQLIDHQHAIRPDARFLPDATGFMPRARAAIAKAMQS